MKNMRNFCQSAACQNGQLTLGLAFGFTMILALFAFVFNTTMNVREKIKLQQTTDYAALVAANAQKEYLNLIRDYNLAIEAQWFSALALQQINHCTTPTFASPAPFPVSNTPYVSVKAQAMLYLTGENLTNLELEADIGSVDIGELCTQICNRYNDGINKKIRSQYENWRKTTQTQVMHLLLNANQEAYQYALHHFLHPTNMPWGLQIKLQSILGEGFTTANALSAYKNNQLSSAANDDQWGYDILSENKNDPLFLPQDEIRPFPVINYVYTGNTGPTYLDYICTGSSPTPRFDTYDATVKIVKKGAYETHFFTGVHYLPPSNMFENSRALRKRRITPDQLGQTENRLTDPSLFRRRSTMTTRSAAKPFGGSFPASTISDLTSLARSLISGRSPGVPPLFDQGAGKTFKGAKLFGIADRDEIGGYAIERANIETVTRDEQGNVQSVWNIRQEDYLH